MSRILKVQRGTIANNAATNVLTVPAGHKYELVYVSLGQSATGSVYQLEIFVLDAIAVTTALDSVPIPSTAFGGGRSYNALVYNAGETVRLRATVTSGIPSLRYSVHFIDVTL